MPLRFANISPPRSYNSPEMMAIKTFTLVECPSGTGQLISRLTNDEIDVAIALTDPLISGIANGSKAYKLVGSYVNTPLDWSSAAAYLFQQLAYLMVGRSSQEQAPNITALPTSRPESLPKRTVLTARSALPLLRFKLRF
ncbi:hypothetical protein EDB86DRAFT_3094478 [Lactarius hatsudake]|nr:hypothetical protein EDB86DRAFT_3094478 [Lactarius hatsudake]